MLSKITESCRFLLNNYPEAQECRDYINSRLTQDSQEKFQYGYFPGVQNIIALTTLVGEETLRKQKLFYTKDIEDSLGPRSVPQCYFENYPLVLPFKDTYGNIVALVGRTLLSEEERKAQQLSKYKNTIFQKGNYIFGLFENKQHIVQQDYVYVVEGQIDVIKAMEKGLKNIVALGNANMTYYQFSVITRYTNNIFLLLDNDEAGTKGRQLILNKFGRFADIRNFYIPESYKDIDEYVTKEGINSYEEMSFSVRD